MAGPRWEYPEDRFELMRWMSARHPGRLRIHHNPMRDSFTFMLRGRGPAELWWDATRVELESARPGWRATVAYMLRTLRRKLRAGLVYDHVDRADQSDEDDPAVRERFRDPLLPILDDVEAVSLESRTRRRFPGSG